MKITNVNIYHENHVFQPGSIDIQGESISRILILLMRKLLMARAAMRFPV